MAAVAGACARPPQERGPGSDLSPDSTAVLRLAEGIKEEMMIVMLDVLQVAAHACARVCVQRLAEQRKLLLHCVEDAEALREVPGDLAKTTSPPITPASEVVKRKTSFYDLFEEEQEPHAKAQGDPGQIMRMTSGDSEPVKPEDDNLEEMYDDLDKSVAKLRAALADRRKQLQDAGVYESDDEDVFDLHALLEGAGGTSGASVGLAGAAGLLPPSLRDADVPNRGLQFPDSRLHSRRMSASSSCGTSGPMELPQPEEADSAGQLCACQRLDSDGSAGAAGSVGSARHAGEAEGAEPPLADEAEPVSDGPATEEEECLGSGGYPSQT